MMEFLKNISFSIALFLIGTIGGCDKVAFRPNFYFSVIVSKTYKCHIFNKLQRNFKIGLCTEMWILYHSVTLYHNLLYSYF